MNAALGTSLAALVLVAGSAAAQASGDADATIEPDGGSDQGYLVRPSAFAWSSYGVTGRASKVRWSHWGSQKTIGQGRTRFCVTMGGGCESNVRVTFTASARHAYQGPEDTQYIYCRMTVRGHLDPSRPARVLTIKLARPEAEFC